MAHSTAVPRNRCRMAIVPEGDCAHCNAPIEVGHLIGWAPTNKQKFHINCEDKVGITVTIGAQPDPEPEPATPAIPGAPQPVPTVYQLPMDPAPTPVITFKTVIEKASQPKPAAGPNPFEAMVDAMWPLIEPRIAKPETIAEDTIKDLLAPLVKAQFAALEKRVTHTINIVRDTGNGPIASTVTGSHPQLAQLIRLLSRRNHNNRYRPVWMYGAAGGGKTHAARQAAKELGVALFDTITLTPMTSESKIMGYMDAHSRYVKTAFYNVCKFGGLFLFDEFDTINGGMSSSINTIVENGICAFPEETFELHPDARFVAATNTVGLGGTRHHQGKSVIDEATRSRFYLVEWNYDLPFERALARSINPELGETWADFVIAVREFCAGPAKIELVVTPRASFDGACILADQLDTLDGMLNGLVFKGAGAEIKTKVLNAVPVPKAISKALANVA